MISWGDMECTLLLETWTPKFCQIFFTNRGNFSSLTEEAGHPFPAKVAMDSPLLASLQGTADPTNDPTSSHCFQTYNQTQGPAGPTGLDTNCDWWKGVIYPQILGSITESKGACTTKFDRYCQIAIYRNHTNLCSHQQCITEHISPIIWLKKWFQCLVFPNG